MNLERVIDTVASQADDLLADIKTRAEARLALTEWLEKRQPALGGEACSNVVDSVMSILEDEGFFTARLTDSFDGEPADDMAEE